MKKVFPVGEAEIEEIMKTLDSDNSGEIDEKEWRTNLSKCPKLLSALIADLDYETGRLKSYRGLEDQLAKLLGNIQRIEYDLSKGGEDEAKLKEELASRKAQADKLLNAGILPAPGVVVFNQLDLKKKREIGKPELKNVLTKLKLEDSEAALDKLMDKLDLDKNGTVDEAEWLEALDKCHSLKAALVKDIDPKTGMLKSLLA